MVTLNSFTLNEILLNSLTLLTKLEIKLIELGTQ